MSLDSNAVLQQIDDVLAECRLVSSYSDQSDLPEAVVNAAVIRLFAAVRRLSPKGSNYAKAARIQEKNLGLNVGEAYHPLVGILQALRADYESGFLRSVEELIHADLFADFLDMAQYLLDQNYKDPAAVIAGSVLEEHLRKLCKKFSILTTQPSGAPKKS